MGEMEAGAGARESTGRWSDGWFYAATIDRMTAGVRSYVADRLPEGERVLDACCGTGALALRLARQGRRVTGVDLSRRHIDYARTRARSTDLGPDQIRFEVGDVSDLQPPPAGPYDVAVTVLSLHEMEAPTRVSVLETLTDVARRVMVVDFAAPMPWNLAGFRNRAAELVAGPAHFRSFLDYSRNGGLEPLIDQGNATVEHEREVDAGTLHVVTLRTP